MPPKKSKAKTTTAKSRRKKNEAAQIVDDRQIGNQSQTIDLCKNADNSPHTDANQSTGQSNNDSIVNLVDKDLIPGKNLFFSLTFQSWVTSTKVICNFKSFNCKDSEQRNERGRDNNVTDAANVVTTQNPL